MTLLAGASAQSLTDRFFDEYYFPFNPGNATYQGIHAYDNQLNDTSPAGRTKRGAVLRQFEADFSKQPSGTDRDMILSAIRADLLELDVVRNWERNPDFYPSMISSAVFTIMKRSYAPPEVRLRSVISREQKALKLLQDARGNLKNPPKIYTEIALEQLPGTIGFFEKDVPLAFNAVKDAKLLAEFKQANRQVMQALREFEAFLKKDILPKSNGDYRIGADTFSKKLLYEEMVDIPLDRLLEIGYADLRANQKKFREVAASINKASPANLVLASTMKDHPAPANLLEEFRQTTAKLRDYIVAKKIVTLPSPLLPILEETPPFMRATTLASMDTPGPYEANAKEAYFNVTLPEKSWTKERAEDFMGSFNRGTILATAVHEAYPGHYTQFLWMHTLDSRVRKLLGAASNAEGWAHYTEQMILDEGYSIDPRLRLGQLQDALLRNGRYIAGIEMHTGKRTFESAVEFFQKECYQPHETAMLETKRGTSDPTYLYYTLGKLQILKLREDYKKMRGAKYSLLEFHDNFMKQGFPPIKIVRRAMLGNDSPTL